MKKLVFVFAVGAMALTSCGGGAKKAADIKVADLKDACGCVDAMDVVATEVLALIDPFATEDDLEKDEAAMKSMDALEDKFGEIEDHCRKSLKVEKDALKECDAFAGFETKMEKVEEKL